MQSRRTLLASVGAISTMAIAGCSGGGPDGAVTDSTDSQSEQTNNTDQSDNDTDSEETSSVTETEPQFSTEGNDSELIDQPVDQLLLSVDDLPGSGWEETEGSGDITFERDNSSGNTETIFISIDEYDNVSDAEAYYDNISLSPLQTGTGEAQESRELEIAVESTWYSGTGTTGSEKGISVDLIKIRDANVSGFIYWGVTGTQEANAVTLQQIGELAVTWHEQWR